MQKSEIRELELFFWLITDRAFGALGKPFIYYPELKSGFKQDAPSAPFQSPALE
ncbi:hypothetical protein ACFPIK_12850 [Algoriphagus aquatilis]|uniref:Uncharacterized protein n=1 Tax=Algoriphagus aquatilis TaxID=490186 RepID=A0ABW0BYC5_9BACT